MITIIFLKEMFFFPLILYKKSPQNDFSLNPLNVLSCLQIESVLIWYRFLPPKSSDHQKHQVVRIARSRVVLKRSVVGVVTNNSSFQNYPHQDDHTIRITVTDIPGFKSFTEKTPRDPLKAAVEQDCFKSVITTSFFSDF